MLLFGQCILELRKIGKFRHLIDTDCAALLVSSLVLSKLDYCNFLLAGLPIERLRLQTVQNNAALQNVTPQLYLY